MAVKIYDKCNKNLLFDKDFERAIIKTERFLMVVRQLSPQWFISERKAARNRVAVLFHFISKFYLHIEIMVATRMPKPIIKDNASYVVIAITSKWRNRHIKNLSGEIMAYCLQMNKQKRKEVFDKSQVTATLM